MKTDGLGLWLQNRHLVNDIDEVTLSLKKEEIIKLFGGFRQMLFKLLQHHHDLTWIQHNKLSAILYKEEKISIRSDTDSFESISSFDSCSIRLTSLPTNILCYINTFMTIEDLGRNQLLCTLLCKINRMTASYSTPRYSMRNLSIVPYLPQYIEWTLNDNNIETKLKGIKNMRDILLFKDIKVIERSGIIPYIMKSIDINANGSINANAWGNVLNEELQLEIMNFLQLCCDDKECAKIIMNNGGAEIFTSSLASLLNKLSIDYDEYEDLSDFDYDDFDYTHKMIKNIVTISYVIGRRSLKFRDMFIKVRYFAYFIFIFNLNSFLAP